MTTVPSLGILPRPSLEPEKSLPLGGSAGPELVAPEFSTATLAPSCYRFGQVICDLAGKANTDFILALRKGTGVRKGI